LLVKSIEEEEEEEEEEEDVRLDQVRCAGAHPVVKVRGPGGGSAPCSGLSPLLLMKKCYFMHKMCQIPHPIDASLTWPL